MLTQLFKKLNTWLYVSISVLLISFSIILIFASVFNLYTSLLYGLWNDLILVILQSAWAIIIAAAISDVAKYMYEEWVKDKQLKRISEARETLTKIVVIISIAVAIEWLIYIFKAWIKDIALLIYPAILLVSSTIMIVWLWVYHKLTNTTKKK